MKKDKYHQLLKFLFDREECRGDWRLHDDLEKPEIEPEELVEYVKIMLDGYCSDLKEYSDWQLGLGFEYIFSEAYSMADSLWDGRTPIASRIACISSLKNLYSNCLDSRCLPTLGHLSESGNSLNSFCYMLWDANPLAYYEMPENDETYLACANVMEHSLYLSNPACVESGLHGLGHLVKYYPESSNIIKKYLKTKPRIDSRLVEYANKAEKGNVL